MSADASHAIFPVRLSGRSDVSRAKLLRLHAASARALSGSRLRRNRRDLPFAPLALREIRKLDRRAARGPLTPR